MSAFADFILQVTYPPNPIRALDSSRTPEEEAGKAIFEGPHVLFNKRCVDCHTTDPQGNPAADRPGFFGTQGLSAYLFFEPNLLKVPHLRNLYQKVGMFGFVGVPGVIPGDAGPMGDQVRGFGYTHDGGVDTTLRFHSAVFFAQSPQNPEGIPATPEGYVMRQELNAFLLSFDSNMAPIVGQQATLAAGNAAVVGPRVDLLVARANAGECDLIAKDRGAGRERGYLYVGAGQLLGDVADTPPVAEAALRQSACAPGHEVTYTCTPVGSGARLGVDRDGDGFLDGDEIMAGSDPADAMSTP